MKYVVILSLLLVGCVKKCEVIYTGTPQRQTIEYKENLRIPCSMPVTCGSTDPNGCSCYSDGCTIYSTGLIVCSNTGSALLGIELTDCFDDVTGLYVCGSLD